jgi:iron complex outermembrane receptor protein
MSNRKMFRGCLVLTAAISAGLMAASSIAASDSSNQGSPLEEIVVTAQKREQRLQDVPVPVTAIDTQALVQTDQVSIKNFYTSVPGLDFSQGQWGEPRIFIRGIVSNPYANPTTGILVDDVPYGLSVNQNGGGAPDIDPGDLARIEVLRGPQGTLYGSDSMGGLIKYVTIDPSTEALSGRLEVGGQKIQGGSDLGYDVRGSVNVPVTDTLAVRASAFTRTDPGYLDNVLTGRNDVNRNDVDGGRLAALWKPSDDLSVKVNALLQDARAQGAGFEQPELGDLKQSVLPPGGQYDRLTQAYSGIVNAKVGTVDLVSLTGYNIDSFKSYLDLSPLFGGLNPIFFPGAGGTGALYNIDQHTRKFSEELRASTQLGSHVDLLVGAFFTDERNLTNENLYAVNPSLQNVGTYFYPFFPPFTYREAAIFADLTFHVTDQFDVQVGGRQSQIRESQPAFADTGALASPPTAAVSSTQSPFTYLVTPEFRFTPDLMLYARIASGFRPGGFNPASLGVNLPSYQPDRTYNYELGLKGDVLDHKVTLDASVYYIEWKGIQLLALNPTTNISYYVNGSNAKSEGIELSVDIRPLTGLTISSWVTLSDAELTDSLPAGGGVYGNTGDPLPYSARFSGNLSVEQRFPLSSKFDGVVAASARYVGERFSAFAADSTTPRLEMPAYAEFGLRFGVVAGSWNFNGYMNNLANRRGITDVYTYVPGAVFVIQPRTVGLNVTKNF